MWLMHADGSDRRWIGGSEAPSWSLDGRQFLINSNSLPSEPTVLNFDTKDGGVIEVSGHQIFSWPSWAGPGTLVSALATNGEANEIALLDVRKPGEAKIIEVLWKRGGELDVKPRWPVYQPDTRRCVFVGEEPTKRTLYSIQRGESRRAKRMEVVEHQRPGQQHHIAGLSFSPDGRYLLLHEQTRAKVNGRRLTWAAVCSTRARRVPMGVVSKPVRLFVQNAHCERMSSEGHWSLSV